MIFIPRSYGIFHLISKTLLCHGKKIVLITQFLSGNFCTFSKVPEGYHCWYSYEKFSSHLDGISAKSSVIARRRASSLLIWTHYVFIGVKVRSRLHLHEPAHLRFPQPFLERIYYLKTWSLQIFFELITSLQRSLYYHVKI